MPLKINGTYLLPLKISGVTYLRFPSEVSALLNLLLFHAPNPKWSPCPGCEEVKICGSHAKLSGNLQCLFPCSWTFLVGLLPWEHSAVRKPKLVKKPKEHQDTPLATPLEPSLKPILPAESSHVSDSREQENHPANPRNHEK